MPQKRIAVVIRSRLSEALRMALGLLLADDSVDVFLLGRKFNGSEQDAQNLALMKEMGIHVYSDERSNPDMEYLSTPELARRLATYDHVLPY